MTAAFRKEVLKMALEDPDTRRKLDLAPSWDDCIVVLVEFAKAKGLRVVQL
jgi:hypothetical protein